MRLVLIVDALINLLLGILLILFPPSIVELLGMPPSATAFYPNILGAIFVGITIALVIGAFDRRASAASGLGVLGAIAINLCGGTALAVWLLFGRLNLPTRGLVILWALVAVLVVVSLAELVRFTRSWKNGR